MADFFGCWKDAGKYQLKCQRKVVRSPTATLLFHHPSITLNRVTDNAGADREAQENMINIMGNGTNPHQWIVHFNVNYCFRGTIKVGDTFQMCCLAVGDRELWYEKYEIHLSYFMSYTPLYHIIPILLESTKRFLQDSLKTNLSFCDVFSVDAVIPKSLIDLETSGKHCLSNDIGNDAFPFQLANGERKKLPHPAKRRLLQTSISISSPSFSGVNHPRQMATSSTWKVAIPKGSWIPAVCFPHPPVVSVSCI